jgi:hypothetical protein
MGLNSLKVTAALRRGKIPITRGFSSANTDSAVIEVIKMNRKKIAPDFTFVFMAFPFKNGLKRQESIK